MYDVVIIGAGVIGSAIARELGRYKGKICVVEQEEEICCGTSKANSAIIHAGFDAPIGSNKAKWNVEGNALMDQLAKDLDFPFTRNGSMVIAKDSQEQECIQELYNRGKTNGVKNIQLLNKEEAQKLEPALSNDITGVLYAPTGGIVCPFLMTIGLAENAFANGVEFLLDRKVLSIHSTQTNDCGYELETTKGKIETKIVVNAAGVYADEIHQKVSRKKMHISPRRGEYCLLDKGAGAIVRHTIFQAPGKMGKGVLVTPTIHGNLLLGPTAEDIEDKEEVVTTRGGMEEILLKASKSIPNLPYNQIITSFAGLRAHEEEDDFVVGEVEDAKGFYNAAGIESPGLSSAPAIGIFLANQIALALHLPEKKGFISTRKGINVFKDFSLKEQANLIAENKAYGTVVCRCEMVTEGEILDAIHRPLGATTLDGVKRRTRTGMGRCQSGFCAPKVLEILARELGKTRMEITKSGKKSNFLTGKTK